MSRCALLACCLAVWILRTFGTESATMLRCFDDLPPAAKASAKFLTLPNYNVLEPLRYLMLYERPDPEPPSCLRAPTLTQ